MSDRLRQALEDTTEIQEGVAQAQKELAKNRARMEYLQVLIAMGNRVAIPAWDDQTGDAALSAGVTAASVVIPRPPARIPAPVAPARPARVTEASDEGRQEKNADALKAAEEKIREAKERTRRAEEMVAAAQAEADVAEAERRATEERARKAEAEAKRLEAQVAR